ncbi:hypothetical protein M23134_03550 [Microscilla marina ATCC 23134]|uniref:HNH domain-containing protein n=1 Tax=Microscilla marina ATCC 23134 TaxID=313606 RepID=A1ZNA8_MICM2|nr:hypothetical protein M23134_03550 [Microscilla marina ATCC 23134]
MPYNASIYHLLYSTNANITALRNALNGNDFRQANIELINLTNNTYVSQLIDENREAIKSIYAQLANVQINGANITVANFSTPSPGGNFTGGLPNANFPEVDVNGKVWPALGKLLLEQDFNNWNLFKAPLEGTAGVDNNVQILSANINNTTIENIATLLLLKQLLHYARLRAEYENLYSFKDNGQVYINYFIFQPNLGSAQQEYNSSNFAQNRSLLNQVSIFGQLQASSLPTGTNALHFNQWTRQGMQVLDRNPLVIMPASDAKNYIKRYINQLNTGGATSSYAKTGGKLLIYVQRHYAPSSNKTDNILSYTAVTADAGRGYRQAKPSLIRSTGLYCAFCESPIQDGRTADIEHKMPKSVFPTEALDWENFVLACKVCNSDNKKEKIVNNTHEVAPGTDYKRNAFVPANNTLKSYSVYRDNSRNEVLWPDAWHSFNDGTGNTQYNLSFQAFDYQLFSGPGASGPLLNVSLDNIQNQTKSKVSVANVAGSETLQIDFTGFEGILDQTNVRVHTTDLANLPQNHNNVGIQAARQHIVDICGLDKIGSISNDRRVVNRTKAWLHAMKQLKRLKSLADEKDSWESLHRYYNNQLDLINVINKNQHSFSNINKLRAFNLNNQADEILFHSITLGKMKFQQVLPNGSININLDGVEANDITIIQIGGGNVLSVADTHLDGVQLVGDIVTINGQRLMSGRIDINDGNHPHLSNTVILFKNVIVKVESNPNTTTLDIGSPTQQPPLLTNLIFTKDAYYGEAIETWEKNRKKLLTQLDTIHQKQLAYTWENILDMVRVGGFYSTWVRTFQRECTNPANNLPRYDIDLVRRLEMEAQANPEDPHQFHGTDAAEIIQSLA